MPKINIASRGKGEFTPLVGRNGLLIPLSLFDAIDELEKLKDKIRK